MTATRRAAHTNFQKPYQWRNVGLDMDGQQKFAALQHHRLHLAAAVFVLASLLIPAAAPALAAEESLTITPTTVNRVVQPGSLNTGSFQLLNQGKTGYTFTIYPEPYRVDGEDYTPDFTLLPGTTKVSDWFQFSVLNGYIAPGQAINVDYTIVVPRGIAPGGYYAVAFAQTQPQVAPATSNIVINERVGEIFICRSPGRWRKRAKLPAGTQPHCKNRRYRPRCASKMTASCIIWRQSKLMLATFSGMLNTRWTGRRWCCPKPSAGLNSPGAARRPSAFLKSAAQPIS